MRTLSARILLGFAALTVTFAAITALVVYNTSQVEDQVTLIGKGYMQLALGAKDLARRQDDLGTTSTSGCSTNPTPRSPHWRCGTPAPTATVRWRHCVRSSTPSSSWSTSTRTSSR